ncbi:hypothetical protein [Vreelandella populi]|uniref:hypothetical protein n=1 Tax=Vreelandella populi TaxID=2498858 RepID=UPI000F8F1644|nr:hypothetical protein [Halomonas populi]RUR51408.1 hypothetical protein ELY40_16540 [Halomonas populi]
MTDTGEANWKAKVNEVVGLLDRAWEAKWAVQLIQFVLFLDLAMVITGQPGLIGWDSGEAPILSNLNFAIITLTSFVTYAAFLTPIASQTIRIILVGLPLVDKLLPTSNSEQPYGYVHISYYGKQAYKRNDQYMIDYYLSRQASGIDARNFRRRSGDILFGTAVVIVLNAFPSIISIDTSYTLLQSGIEAMGPFAFGVISCFLLIFSWRAITNAWFDSPLIYIEQPELYREQQAKIRDEQMDIPTYTLR